MKLLSRILVFLLCLSLIFALVLLMAPLLVDSLVLPRLLSRAGLPERSVELWRLSPFRLQGSVHLNSGDGPLLTIPRLEIHYTPGSLLQRRLTRLVLDQATLHLELREGRPVLPAWPHETRTRPRQGESLLLLPLAVDEVVLRSCSVLLHEAGQPDLRIGLTASSSQRFSPAGDQGHHLRSLLGTFSLSEAVTAAGSLSLATGDDLHQLALSLEGGPAALLDRLLPTGLDSSMFGTLSLTGSLALNARTLGLEHLATSGSLRHCRAELAGLAGGGAGADQTLEFSFAGPPEQLEYRVSGLRLTRPVMLSAALQGSAVSGNGAVRLSGSLDTTLEGLPQAGEEADIAIAGTYQAFFSAEGLEAGLSLTSRPPPLGSQETPIELSAVSAGARLIRRGERTSVHFSGAIPQLSLPSRELLLTDIAFELPVELNPAAAPPGKAGSFSIGALSLKQQKLLSLTSRVTQHQETFQLSGSARALFHPQLKAVFNGMANPGTGQARLSWNLPDTELSSSSLPPALGPPPGLSFDTRLAASGTLDYGSGRFTGTARGSLSEGSLVLPENGLALEGVDCSLELPRLPAAVSSPSQRCTARAIDIGKLHFSDGAVAFRLEDRETLFIEGSRATWCQGTVESGSLRLAAGRPELETTLYCSMINFSELLNQLGLDQTEGQGSLNGKLPVHLSDKGLAFDHGFLFSTPGTGGIVRFTRTDMLRQGMADVGQAGYLNYSLKALEDFAYDWTRLSFNTEGEDLLLAMHLEGRPRTALPFGFRDGQIVETRAVAGLQHPLRLDVNFRLPLSQLLRVGQNIKALMENRQ